jgi:hypothetical protein
VSVGWAYDGPRTDAGSGRLHLQVDASGVTARLHVEGGGWVLRGGCVGGSALWRRAGTDGQGFEGEAVEGEAVALGFTGPHRAYDVAVALRVHLTVGESRRVRLVEVTEPVLATRLVDRLWSRPAADRWVVDDLATGERQEPDPDTIVAGMTALGWSG